MLLRKTNQAVESADCVPRFQLRSMKHRTVFLTCPSTLASSNTSLRASVQLEYPACPGCPQLAKHSLVFESRYSEIHQMVMFPNKVMWTMTQSCLGGLECSLMPNQKKAAHVAQKSKGISSLETMKVMGLCRDNWGRLLGARNYPFSTQGAL